MELYWEDDYAVAIALKRVHPNSDPSEVDFETLHRWIVELPEFVDDKTVTAVYLLEAIQREWCEEVAPNESAA
ncbi:MAG TPA: Fe-S cluster assembly protein IscX [Anaerolineae bacterium]